jgi:hypothetical protein
MNQFPPSPEYPKRAVSNVFVGTTGVTNTGGKWKKSKIIQFLNILIGNVLLTPAIQVAIPPVSLIPAANLLSVSLIPVVHLDFGISP